jgi:O-antigen/teichoic acid export membrane protein
MSAIFRSIFQLSQVVALAHLLPPSSYGLVAILYAVIGFVIIFSDFGLNAAFVSASDVSYKQRVSLFWLNIIFSLITTLVLFLFSSFIGEYYNDIRLVFLIKLLSITIIIGALGQQIKISSEKSLMFKPVAIIEIFSGLLGLSVCIFLAVAGCDVYSIVAGSVCSSLFSTIFIWVFLSKGFKPILHFSLSEIKPFLEFGIASIGAAILGNISKSFDIFIGGRYLSATELGFYSVPRNLSLQIQFVINPIVSRVGFPLIAKSKHNRDLVRLIYLKTMNMTSSVNAPIYVLMFFFSDEIVRILFGLNWQESSILLKILAIWGGVRSTLNPIGSLAEGMGRADLEFKWTLFCVFFFPIGIMAGGLDNSNQIAFSQLALISFLIVPNWFFLVRPLCGASLLEYSIVTFKPFILSIFAAFLSFLLLMKVTVPGYRLFFGCFITLFIYAFVSFSFNRAWLDSMLELFIVSYKKK